MFAAMWWLIAAAVGGALGLLAIYRYERGTYHQIGGTYFACFLSGAIMGVVVGWLGRTAYRGVEDGYGWPLLALGVGLVGGTGLALWRSLTDENYEQHSRWLWPIALGGYVLVTGALVGAIWATDIFVSRLDRSVRAATGLGLGTLILAAIAAIIIGVVAAANDSRRY